MAWNEVLVEILELQGRRHLLMPSCGTQFCYVIDHVYVDHVQCWRRHADMKLMISSAGSYVEL